MIPKIKTGIPGLDKLLNGGIPENTVTLLYGPPKTGKSIFCAHFLNQGLLDEQPCLYIFTDYNMDMLIRRMAMFNWSIEKSVQKEMVYRIDLCSTLGGTAPIEKPTLRVASPKNPTDFMIKSAGGLKFLTLKAKTFRAIMDSATTLFSYNEPALVARMLRAWSTSVKTSGATGLITYTEGSTDPKIETMLKSTVDNIIKMKESEICIEAMVGKNPEKLAYEIGENGIKI